MNVDRNIVRIARLTASSGKLIHDTGMAILHHAFEHRDPRKLTALLKAIHKSARPEAFKVWVEDAGPIVFEKGIARMDTSETAKPWNLVGAAALPYFEAREAVGKPLTLEALLKVLEGVSSKVTKVKDGKLTMAQGEDMAALHALGAKLKNVIRDVGQIQAQTIPLETTIEAKLEASVAKAEASLPDVARARIMAVIQPEPVAAKPVKRASKKAA